MSAGDPVLTHGGLHSFRKFQQSQHVADCGAIHTKLTSEIFDRAAEVCQIVFERNCLFNDIQVFAFQVLFDGGFTDLPIIQLYDATRHGFQTDLA